MTQNNPRANGFTLIEVLVALSIFAIVCVGLPGVLISTVQANTYARRISAATNFARDKVEALRNTPYATVSGGSDTVADTGGTTGNYTRTWTVSNGPVTNTKIAKVKVAWTDTLSRQVELDVMISG